MEQGRLQVKALFLALDAGNSIVLVVSSKWLIKEEEISRGKIQMGKS